MRVMKTTLFVLFIASIGFVVPAYAGVLGAAVDAKAEYPNIGNIYADGGPATIGAGVEYPAGTFAAYNGNISIDLTDTQIFISLNGTSTFFLNAAFNGFDITFLTGSIASATVDGASTFNPVISIVGNDLYLNYQGVSASGVSVIDIVGSNGNVPEPGSLILLGTGLLGAVGVMRRKINL